MNGWLVILMFEIFVCMNTRTQIFSQSKYCTSSACQLNCFVIKTPLQDKLGNFGMAGNLVIKMKTMGDKSESECGISWRRFEKTMFDCKFLEIWE